MDSEKRRRQVARAKYERQQQRRVEAQQRARRRNSVVGVSLAVLLLGGGAAWAGASLGGGDGATAAASSDNTASSPTASTASSPTAARSAADPASVKGCKAPVPGNATGKKWKTEPALTVDTKATYTAVLKTSCGAVTLELNAAKAPHTVNSFVYLAGQRYFDHVPCHRLTTEGIFVLQCGDPTGSGSGGPGYQFKDENLKGATYPAGTVAMANAGANTNGSQFFLVYQDTQLPPNYTPFGKVSGGMEVLKNIAAGGVVGGATDGAPVAGVKMDSVTVAKR